MLMQLTCWDWTLATRGFSAPGHVTTKGPDQLLSHAALVLMAWGGKCCFNPVSYSDWLFGNGDKNKGISSTRILVRGWWGKGLARILHLNIDINRAQNTFRRNVYCSQGSQPVNLYSPHSTSSCASDLPLTWTKWENKLQHKIFFSWYNPHLQTMSRLLPKKIFREPFGLPKLEIGSPRYISRSPLDWKGVVPPGGGGGDSNIKKVGMLVDNFEIDPYGRPIWAWRAHFFTPKRD